MKIPYYGFIVFSIVTLLYSRLVEKKNFKYIGFSGNPIEFFWGAFVAVILLFTIIGICCISGSISFGGFNTNVNIKNYLLWVCVFGIQGATEEIMCRGFLLNSLKTRISREASTKLELANELKEKVLTDENKQKAKKGLKIVAIIFGIILLIDVISMIVYFSLYGFPQ